MIKSQFVRIKDGEYKDIIMEVFLHHHDAVYVADGSLMFFHDEVEEVHRCTGCERFLTVNEMPCECYMD